MTPFQEATSPEDDPAWAATMKELEWKTYPFEDFARHMDEVNNRRLENTADDLGAFFRNIKRLKAFFDEFYDEPESIRNHGSFVMAMEHVARYADSYDTELFGVAHDGGLVWSEGLQRAVHWYFAVIPRSEWVGDDEAVVRIKEWARNWIATHTENEEGEQGVRGNAG